MDEIAGDYRVAPGYGLLARHLMNALEQASKGKGKERHAQDGQPFERQQICTINKEIGSHHGCLYQASKKAIESVKILELHGKEAAKAEIYGAINYLAAACIILDEME